MEVRVLVDTVTHMTLPVDGSTYTAAVVARRRGTSPADVWDEVKLAGDCAFFSYEECDIDEPEPTCALAEEMWDLVETMEEALGVAVGPDVFVAFVVALLLKVTTTAAVLSVDEDRDPDDVPDHYHQVVHDLIAAPAAPPLSLAGM